MRATGGERLPLSRAEGAFHSYSSWCVRGRDAHERGQNPRAPGTKTSISLTRVSGQERLIKALSSQKKRGILLVRQDKGLIRILWTVESTLADIRVPPPAEHPQGHLWCHVVQRTADGQVAVMSHDREKDAVSCPKGDEENIWAGPCQPRRRWHLHRWFPSILGMVVEVKQTSGRDRPLRKRCLGLWRRASETTARKGSRFPGSCSDTG